jgi:SM-20-related protein
MIGMEALTEHFYQNGYAVYDNFISEAEADTLLNEIKVKQDNLQKAGIGNGQNHLIDKEIRGDYIRWINPAEDLIFKNLYLDKLEPIILSFNRSFFLGIKQSEHHLAFYPPGTRYEKHRDSFQNNKARVVSSVLYLNKSWHTGDGGELIIYPEKKESIKTEPVAGRLVLFESHLEHEVLLSHKPRYSITGWMRQ